MKFSVSGNPEAVYEAILREVETQPFIKIPVSVNNERIERTYDLAVLRSSIGSCDFEIEVSVDYEASILIKGGNDEIRLTYKNKAPHINKADFEAIARYLHRTCSTAEERRVNDARAEEAKEKRSTSIFLIGLLLLVALSLGSCMVTCGSSEKNYMSDQEFFEELITPGSSANKWYHENYD